MIEQFNLFGEPVVQKRKVEIVILDEETDGTPIEPDYPIDLCITPETLDRQVNKDDYTDDFIIDYLTNKANLWDMRFWDQFKDTNEIRHKILAIQAVHDPFSVLNDGHAAFWIHTYLRRKGSTLEAHRDIMQCFMFNNNISYKQRITPCALDLKKCHHFVQHLNTAMCPCYDCNSE